ncbi:MAG: hypothetical protein RML12_03000 [Xanthomonadales bacterium]|nr:hypothetical protein [Xanthomonadales bacterium]
MAAASAEPDRGLRRKIWVAFVLQVVAISLATVLGVHAASTVLKDVLIRRALTDEAGHFWGRLARDPGAELPDTYNMKGYLEPAPPGGEPVPEELRSLAPGFHALPRALRRGPGVRRGRRRRPAVAGVQAGPGGPARLLLRLRAAHRGAADPLPHRVVHLPALAARGLAGDLARQRGAALGSEAAGPRGAAPGEAAARISTATSRCWRAPSTASRAASRPSSSASATSRATPATSCARR